MDERTRNETTTADREIVISRVLDAPRELVFQAWTAQFHVTVTFDKQGKKTKLTMRSLFPSAAERDKVVKEYGAIEGGNQTLDRLEEHLAKMAS